MEKSWEPCENIEVNANQHNGVLVKILIIEARDM